MVGRLKDVQVFRGVAAGMSDHFLFEAKVVVAKEWGNRVVGCSREVVKVEELKKPTGVIYCVNRNEECLCSCCCKIVCLN